MPPSRNKTVNPLGAKTLNAHKLQDACLIEVLFLDPPRGGSREGQMVKGNEY